ncbi:MAG: hypothetical protein WCO06_07095 [Candidatus Roizmanbacteria bacterium]
MFWLKKNNLKILGVVMLILIGIILRFTIGTLGYNFDFDSYNIVAKLVLAGQNVYAETYRYNYAPFWFYFLGLARWISLYFSNPEPVFRGLIVSLVTTAELSIAYVVYKRVGLVPALILFLNPLSIYTTGFHNQFDVLGIAIAIGSMILYEKENENDHIKSYILLGLSLFAKHIFIFMPFFLLSRTKTWKDRILLFIIPYGIFFISFLPYVNGGGWQGILKNVFMYQSLYRMPLAPLVFVMTFSLLGYFLKKYNVVNFAFLYPLVLFIVGLNASQQQYIYPLFGLIILQSIPQ